MKHRSLITLLSATMLLALVAVSCNDKSQNSEQNDNKTLLSLEDLFVEDTTTIATHTVEVKATQPVKPAKPVARPVAKPAPKAKPAQPTSETIYVETEGAQGRVWGHVTMTGDRGSGTIHDWDENTLAVSVTRHGNELFAIDQNSRQYVFKLKQNNTNQQ